MEKRSEIKVIEQAQSAATMHAHHRQHLSRFQYRYISESTRYRWTRGSRPAGRTLVPSGLGALGCFFRSAREGAPEIDRLVGGQRWSELRSDEVCDLDAIIDIGAADITVRLPREHSARVNDEAGSYTIEATALTQDKNVYTNAAYGAPEVTVPVDMESSIVQKKLEAEKAAATSD